MKIFLHKKCEPEKKAALAILLVPVVGWLSDSFNGWLASNVGDQKVTLTSSKNDSLWLWQHPVGERSGLPSTKYQQKWEFSNHFFFLPVNGITGLFGDLGCWWVMWFFYHQHHAWSQFLSVSEGRFELWDADFHYASHTCSWEEYLYKHHKDRLRMRQSSPLYKAPKTPKDVDSVCFSQHEFCLGTWSSSRKALFHVPKSRHLNVSWILFILAFLAISDVKWFIKTVF